jgi:hypothetical protein
MARGRLYVIGAFDSPGNFSKGKSKEDSERNRRVLMIAEKKDGSLSVTAMQQTIKQRCFSSVCALGGWLVVTGGEKSFGECESMCETYCISTNTWNAIASLKVGRQMHASCSFQNRFVYVFAGMRNGDVSANHIEMWDSESQGAWKLIDLKR